MRMRDWVWKVLGISGMLAAVLGCRKAEKRLSIEERAVTHPDEPSVAQKTLDRIDGRVPVPLLPMMVNHQKQTVRRSKRALAAMPLFVSPSWTRRP